MAINRATLRQFLLQEYRTHGVEKDLVFLLEDIATACREISTLIRNGSFLETLGTAGSTNVQGEAQKKLDVIANEQFESHIRNCSRVAALVSEEVDEVTWLKDTAKAGDYIVYFDPLDGSSNLNVNLSVGSIFSIMQLPEDAVAGDVNTVLRDGSFQICSGYSIFGPATTLVLTLGHGVHEFTNHLATGEFRIVSRNMTIPEDCNEFAINASRFADWDAPVRNYIEDCIAGQNGPRGKSFNMRWTASMVVDIHRILTRGGVFLYPVDARNRAEGGKLRLMYEANPIAFLVEQAGGSASTGTARILDIQPESPHQRASVILGSRNEVLRIEEHYRQED
ncbi:class 1 fructose-bisphosphatase [Aliiruegeria lutimaris]|uniref:Fructose-1,6-bisphosphatase class 1 n=1 Tax=Aliiruegeria lutimaris TaxID=571298 RepID=A0A1G8QZL6_9RHOB|nr:class 1 fructose-bisphosphatase [Aliiruegeria lutimaris]SDJ10127.1 D-fructose 1,6-bisphosphatase [Aliiruegeria lutimaris]